LQEPASGVIVGHVTLDGKPAAKVRLSLADKLVLQVYRGPRQLNSYDPNISP